MSQTSKFHQAWDKIFQEKQLDTTRKVHFISAAEIKAISGEEPRLMTKYDTQKALPPILAKHGYFILPLSRREYALVRGKGYHAFEPQQEVKNHHSRLPFSLVTMHRNSSEMQYLDYCHLSGLVEKVINKGPLYQSIRGREGSGDFSFSVGNIPLQVKGAQIEIDGGFEGENCIVLFEAKTKQSDNFLIRQLYYPFKRFEALHTGKEIIPVFFTYNPQDETYNFWVYRVRQAALYGSLELVRQASYRIVTEDHLTVKDILPQATEDAYTDQIPQANDVSKIIETVFEVHKGQGTISELARHFGFQERQAYYYQQAAEALGFIRHQDGNSGLTAKGQQLVTLRSEKRNLFMAQTLNGFSLFKQGLRVLEERGTLTKQDLQQAVSRTGKVSGSTTDRRADSLYAWFKWVATETGAFELTDDGFRA